MSEPLAPPEPSHEFGEQAAAKLAGATVTCIGTGGLGSPSLAYLALSGVGHLHLVDGQEAVTGGHARSVLRTRAQEGMDWLEATQQTLNALNPDIKVSTTVLSEGVECTAEILLGSDVVIDAAGGHQCRYAIDEACAALDLPCVWGSVREVEGYVTVFRSSWGARYIGLYPDRDRQLHPKPSCRAAGVLGSVCGQVGTIMASETVKIIAGVGQPLVGRMQVVNAFDGSAHTVRIAAAPRGRSAPTSPRVDIVDTDFVESVVRGQSDVSWTLVDVRTPAEFALHRIPGAINVPVGELPERLDECAGPVIVYCASGTRARDAAHQLAASGVTSDVALYLGSMAAWDVR